MICRICSFGRASHECEIKTWLTRCKHATCPLNMHKMPMYFILFMSMEMTVFNILMIRTHKYYPTGTLHRLR